MLSLIRKTGTDKPDWYPNSLNSIFNLIIASRKLVDILNIAL